MEEEWAIGPLSDHLGVSVRTLRHYDEIGLLVPERRTTAGHRRYTRADVVRLAQIVTLRSVGLPLSDIRACLNHGEELEATLRRQVENLDATIAAATALRDRLRTALAGLASGREPASNDLIALIGETAMSSAAFYSADDREYLAAREAELGPARIEATQQAWAKLIPAMEAARVAGLPPDHPDVKPLAEEWQRLIELFTGGRESVHDGLVRRNRAEVDATTLATYEYAGAAVAALS